jgi:hypothetical protein
MGRKRNQGKARKAAKAKAKEEAKESNNQVTNEQRQSLADRMQQLQIGNGNLLPTSGSDVTKCYHGFEKMDNMRIDFVIEFREAFQACFQRGSSGILQSLVAAGNATMDKFAVVWTDSSKLKWAASSFLSVGAQYILEDDLNNARDCAIFARYFEQYIEVELHQTQSLFHLPKLIAAHYADVHTLVKFFRKRISCTCLDEKYEEVKHITKIGLCFNQDCPFPNGCVERSKTMYCSRCRSVAYCSRGCQKAHWAEHKPVCDGLKAEFDAKK